jgi:hypothetical protein
MLVIAVVGTGNLVNQVGVAFLQDFQQQLLFVFGQTEFHTVPPANDGDDCGAMHLKVS